MKKDKRALDGAYAKGQTNLDGDMVVEEGAETVAVQKEVAPWSRSTQKQWSGLP